MKNSRNRWCASAAVQERARELRKNITKAEKKLWKVLRGKQLDGLYFRRQHAVGRFIVDFVCVQENLVIEVDGATHLDQEAYDMERSRWLEDQKGYKVLRFTNDDVLEDIDEVITEIRKALQSSGFKELNSPPVYGGS